MASAQNVAILGYGAEGKAALKYFWAQGAKLTVFDTDAGKQSELPPGVEFVHYDSDLSQLSQFELVCRSPGIRPDVIPTGVGVTSLSKEFFKLCPAPIVGVTGTKGKGTTATLIAKILENSGKNVHLVGNIGRPSLDVLGDVVATDVVVYELSSFQLWDLDKSPFIAVVLMVSPDHLDVHADIDEYVAAKRQIVAHQTPEDIAVHHPDNPLTLKIVEAAPGQKIAYMTRSGAYIQDENIIIDDQKICSISEVGLIGGHNLENICAAITAVWQITQDTEAINSAVKAFRGLEHRLQLVGEHDGVEYYDDSFSTTEESAIAAIKSFDAPKIIILGGSDKGADYLRLAETISEGNVKQAILIGETRQKLAAALESVGFKDFEVSDSRSMDEFVSMAKSSAEKGDVVVLSPSCASFGLFDNYKQRGNRFIEAVKNL